MKETRRDIPRENQNKESTGFKDIPFVRSIIDSSREIIALLDRDGILLEFNRALEIRLQKNRDEIIGSCIWNYFPAEISENRKLLTGQVFLTGKAAHLEDCRNGIWNDSVISPVFDAKGAVAHVAVHILDITERKKAEELNYQYQKMLKNLSDNNPGVIFEVIRDKDGLYYMNYMSKGSEKMFGIPVEQLTGQIVPGQVYPADEEMFFKSINDSAESLTDWVCEYRIINPEGKVKWIMGKSQPRKEDDGRIIWNGVLVDITKEKNLEKELLSKELMLKTAQRVAHLGYYQLDVQTGDAEWSDETFRIFGLDPSGYIPSQQKYQELIHPEDWEDLTAALAESIEKKIPFDMVYRIFHSSGEIRYVHSLGKMEKNQDGSTFMMFGTLLDITEQKLTELSLQKANSRLKALWNIASLSGSDLNTICDSTLQAIVEMTGSPYGFLGFLNENESVMKIYSWSGRAMDDCRISGRQAEYIISECGVWGEAVRQRKPLMMNDFSIPHQAKKGLPEGHVPLSRLLVVPVFSLGRIVSVAAVANSPAPYTENDISQITSFMSGIQLILDKHEAEAKLLASEEALRKAQKVAHLGSWEWYIETNRLVWSEEMYNIFGVSREEFTGDLSDIMTRSIHPDDRAAVDQSNRSVIESGKPVPLEYRIILSDGSVKTVWAEAGELRFNKDGKPSVLTGIVQDVTVRKQAELRLKDSEAHFRALFEGSQNPIIIYNADANIISLNEKAAANFGRPVSECVGRSMKEFIPENHQITLSRIKKVLKTNQPLYVEDRIELHDGNHWFWSSIQPIHISYTDESFVQIISYDITDRKKTEESLKSSNEYLQAILDAIPDFLFVVDPRGRILDYRVREQERQYAPPEVFLGKSFYDFLPLEVSTVIAGALDKAVNKGTNKGTIYSLTLPDGEHWYNASIAAEGGAGCPGNRLVVLIHDITEQKQAEAEQKKLEYQLQQSQKLDSIGQLAGGVAHDFNNQLTGIMGYAELITPELPHEKLMRYAANIIQGAKNGAKLTQQLLSFARKGNYTLEIIDVYEILDEVIDILSHTIDKRIQISQTRQVFKPTIQADRSQIQNALLNISLNAKDAIAGKGTIRFESKLIVLADNSKHPLFDLMPGSYICISIRDNGSGMDESVKSRIFDPFFTTKGIGKGTGMGLPAAYGTVKHHGGGIFVETRLQRGSAFHVLLPFVQAETGSSQPRQFLKPSERPAEILVVDDDDNFRYLLQELFENLGYLVYCAKDGEEGLEFYRHHTEQIDLIILDMIMPKKGGAELFHSLKEINPQVKILISSGYSTENSTIAKIVSQGTPFIQKPCSLSELSITVSDLLNRN